jgi:SET domain-containing protein
VRSFHRALKFADGRSGFHDRRGCWLPLKLVPIIDRRHEKSFNFNRRINRASTPPLPAATVRDITSERLDLVKTSDIVNLIF